MRGPWRGQIRRRRGEWQLPGWGLGGRQGVTFSVLPDEDKRWVVRRECTDHSTGHLKVAKMVNFMLWYVLPQWNISFFNM